MDSTRRADLVRSRAEMNLDSTNKAVSVRLEGGLCEQPVCWGRDLQLSNCQIIKQEPFLHLKKGMTLRA